MSERRKRETITKPEGAPGPKEQARRERVRAIMGKYAFVPASSEDFARSKHEEAAREE